MYAGRRPRNDTYSNAIGGTVMILVRRVITGNKAPSIEVNMTMNKDPTLRPKRSTWLTTDPQSVGPGGAGALVSDEF